MYNAGTGFLCFKMLFHIICVVMSLLLAIESVFYGRFNWNIMGVVHYVPFGNVWRFFWCNDIMLIITIGWFFHNLFENYCMCCKRFNNLPLFFNNSNWPRHFCMWLELFYFVGNVYFLKIFFSLKFVSLCLLFKLKYGKIVNQFSRPCKQFLLHFFNENYFSTYHCLL